MVVQIPSEVAGVWKLAAISLITEGIEVKGVRMLAPSKKIPMIKKARC